MERVPIKVAGWLLTAGLALPTAYIAIFPGFYLTMWNRIVSSIIGAGIALLIFLAGLVMVGLYVSTLLTPRREPPQGRSMSDGIFFIHMGVWLTIIAFMVSSVIIRTPPLETCMRASFAFLMTEFMIFPILSTLHLQEIIRHHRADLAFVLLLSVAMYLSMVFLNASNLVDVSPTVGDTQKMAVLEAAGARLLFLLVTVAASAVLPFFWQSTGLYSIDTSTPPAWLGGLYVLTFAFSLYYSSRRSLGSTSNLPSTPDIDLTPPFKIESSAMTILTAAVLAFSVAYVTDLIIPHNFAGRVLQLFLLLILLLATYRLSSRQGLNEK